MTVRPYAGAPLMFVLLVAMPAASQVPKPSGVDRAWRHLTVALDSAARAQHAVGGGVAVVRDGRLVRQTHFGLGDIGTGRPADAQTIYAWASCTKTFTGIAIMQLRDHGKLSLDDPVVKYLPELRLVHDPYGPIDKITIRHLLTHSAGFRAATWPWRDSTKAWQPFAPRSWEQLVAMFPYTEILFEPGSKYSYSNPGFILLGRIIEQLTGDDYEVYIDKNIFKPLEMSRSYFDVTPYHLTRYRANNYDVRNGVPVSRGLEHDTGITVSNGGLDAPMTDMAKYLGFLEGSTDPQQQARYDGVLARASLQEMWKPGLPTGSSRSGATEHVALAFHTEELNGVRVVGHEGGQNAYRSFFYVDPVTGVGVLAAFNSITIVDTTTGRQAEPLHIVARSIVLHDLFPAYRADASRQQ